MQGFRRYSTALVSAALFAAACGQSETYLDDPDGELPDSISALGLFDGATTHPSAAPYAPAFPLWSSGTDKERQLVLPPNTNVTRRDDGEWVFPTGTHFFKTFSWRGQRVETRVLSLKPEGWDYAVYQWDGEEAFLVDLSIPHVVELQDGAETFEYAIPSRRQCRTCHEAGASVVLGFRALQLDESAPYSERIPDTSADIAESDGLTRDVLGYLEGNCTHCHNGRTEFDLRHDVAQANLIGQMAASSGAEPGIRVIPGNPDESLLLRFLRGTTSTDMPPLGVQRRDESAAELVERWIVELED